MVFYSTQQHPARSIYLILQNGHAQPVVDTDHVLRGGVEGPRLIAGRARIVAAWRGGVGEENW